MGATWILCWVFSHRLTITGIRSCYLHLSCGWSNMANLIILPSWNIRWNIYAAPVLTIWHYTYCGGCSVLSLWNRATRRLYKVSRGSSMAVICSLYFDLPFGWSGINNTLRFLIWKASRKIPINPSFTISTWNVSLNWSVVLFWAYVTEVYHLTSQWSLRVVGCSYYLDLSYGCQLIHLSD